jgi:hypothetical protein
MAEFSGLSADKAEEILGMSVVSGILNEFGHLILTRENGTTIDAGDFTGIVTDLLTAQVTAQVGPAVNNAMAGTVVDKGNTSGAITFAEFNSTTLVNALIKITAIGNLTVSNTDFPVAPKPGTQFAMRITQDATGGRTITFTGIKKSQGVLQLTPTANAIDILVFFYDGAQWFVGMMGADLK